MLSQWMSDLRSAVEGTVKEKRSSVGRRKSARTEASKGAEATGLTEHDTEWVCDVASAVVNVVSLKAAERMQAAEARITALEAQSPRLE